MNHGLFGYDTLCRFVRLGSVEKAMVVQEYQHFGYQNLHNRAPMLRDDLPKSKHPINKSFGKSDAWVYRTDIRCSSLEFAILHEQTWRGLVHQ